MRLRRGTLWGRPPHTCRVCWAHWQGLSAKKNAGRPRLMASYGFLPVSARPAGFVTTTVSQRGPRRGARSGRPRFSRPRARICCGVADITFRADVDRLPLPGGHTPMRFSRPRRRLGRWHHDPCTGQLVLDALNMALATRPTRRMSSITSDPGLAGRVSSGRRNTLIKEVAMNTRKATFESIWAGTICRHPCQVDRRWQERDETANGFLGSDRSRQARRSEVAAGRGRCAAGGWEQDGSGRQGGMPPAMFGVSAKAAPLGRYLSRLWRREEIGLLRAQGHTIQEVGSSDRTGSIDYLLGEAAAQTAGTRKAAAWSIAPRQRNGTPSELLAVQSRRSLRSMRHCKPMWRNGLAGAVVAPSGGSCFPGPAVSWNGRRPWNPRQDRRWGKALWSPETDRPPSADRTSRKMRRCASATKPIYQALFVQGRGSLRRETDGVLAHRGGPLRMAAGRRTARGEAKTFTSPEIMISQRPVEAADRAVPGHWEGRPHSWVLAVPRSAPWWSAHDNASLCCCNLPRMTGPWPRSSRGKKTDPPTRRTWCRGRMRDAITRTIITLPEQLRRSLTWDQGAEAGSARTPEDRCGRAGLFLRSSQPMAARHQREHQRVCYASTSPKRHRSQHTQRRGGRSSGGRPEPSPAPEGRFDWKNACRGA